MAAFAGLVPAGKCPVGEVCAYFMNAVRKFFCFALLGVWLSGALVGAALAGPVFPVKYSANKRYLVDQNNVPLPILGRTAWFITSLSVTDYRFFIDDTAARGYTAIEFHVINHDPRGNNPPFSGNGEMPFLKRLDGGIWGGALTYGSGNANITNEAPNLTTPNTNYWNHVDGLLAYAESKGLLVFMFPAYVGFNGGNQGYMQELVANGPTKVQSYGAWIATRYKNQKNLVWMMGGDMGTPPHAFNSAQTSVESALLNGLKSVAGQQSIYYSAEWDSDSISTDQASLGSAMTLNGVYSWTGAVSSHGRRAYAYGSVRPAFLLEEPYDQEGPGPDGNGVNPNAIQPVRRFQWWGWLSTIGGYISGNGYVWPFPSTWKNHLDTQGTRDMTRLNAFIQSIEWYKLVPSGLGGMRTLVTAGGSAVTNADYVAAAATPDGKLLVAYIPPAHNGPITVDMGAMSSLSRARWFDPTSATYTDIGAGLTNSGTRNFTPPGNNSVGQKDWVLVLDRGPDVTDPSLKITAPTTSAALTNTTGKITVAGTAGDNTAVTQVLWNNDRGGSGTAVGTNSWSVSGINLSPGLNVITVTAMDAAGNSAQIFFTVLYRVPPLFTQQPQAQSAATNDTVTFTVSAGGDQPFKYQWRKNGGNLIGGTNSNYTISNITTVHGGSYSVVVANAVGTVTSSNALLKVFVPPMITSQPVGRAVTVGGKVSFKVSASGTATLFYQWRQDGVDIPGATSRSYSLSKIQTNAAGIYTVAVSNFAGVRISSNAVLTVNVLPAFTQQPQGQSAIAGPTNITLTAAATGTEPIKYQWRLSGRNIVGATNASYTVTNVTVNATYSVVAANVAGIATSSNAMLKVFVPPVISAQPLNRTVTVGGSASFTVSVAGTTPLFYQWRHDGVEIAGATNLSYTLANIQTNRAGAYSVTTSNFAGVRVSSNAILTVNVPPAFLAQPSSQFAAAGDPVTLTALASGTQPLKFQWRKNAANIAGATNTSYTIAVVTNSSAGNYSVVVANVAGTVTSSNAVLGVLPPFPATGRDALVEIVPVLDVSLSAGELVLSWSVNATGFTLQSSANLVDWSSLSAPEVSGDRYVVTESVTGPARFYRLVK